MITIEQDYIDLFSYRRKGHLAKYVHMYRPEIYEDLIKQPNYYPFKTESSILMENTSKIANIFHNIPNIVEIGPGSSSPVNAKTIPLLKILQNETYFLTYTALDKRIEYAKEACSVIEKILPDIKTSAVEVDFLIPNIFQKIKEKYFNKGRKMIFSFGQSILANNNESDTNILLDNISTCINEDDYFFFGVDINHNQDLLDNAYNTKLTRELLLNAMHYLKKQFNLDNFDSEAFELVYNWNIYTSTVELFLQPTKTQKLILNNQTFFLERSQIFNIINSRKSNLDYVRKFLLKKDMIIQDIITLDKSQKDIFVLLLVNKGKKDQKFY